MALNNFTLEEAIDICIAVRDELELDFDLPLQERWKKKDALGYVISFAEKKAKEGLKNE